MARTPSPPVRLFRFGPFELDVRAGELRKHGIRIRLQHQPAQILLMLLEHPGEVVLREEIHLQLWPGNTVVEFDHGTNAAIQKLRDALGESADKPRYVETVARRGYRFLGDVERCGAPPAEVEGLVLPVDTPEFAGKVLAHYRVIRKLAEGSTGAVYHAEDLKLGRQVAIRILPGTPAEFEPAACAAAALSHPHICTIHALENLGGYPAIVMELVEGETLTARLAKGPLPPNQSLAFAIQIAGALAEAHRNGVLHLDLKPGNIMLTKSGIKVLDLGLEQMRRAAFSPQPGQWKETDSRSDTFSFGLVLYEMLTGRQPVEGRNAAGILEHEIPPLDPSVPPVLSKLLFRCLAKNPEERWQSARDLEVALKWATETKPQPRTDSHFVRRWLVAAMVAALAVVTFIVYPREKLLEQRVLRLQIPTPGAGRTVFDDAAAISPDGTRIVFSGGNNRKLFVRSLDSLVVHELEGTEGGHQPFWSPNGRYLGFFAGGKLKKTSILGGPPVALCDAPGVWGGTWNRDGVILLAATARSPITRISADGGPAVPVTRLDAARGETSHAWPFFLPDGKHFLFSVHASEPAADGVFIGSIDSPQVSRLLSEETNAQYTEPGYVLFSRDGSLMAQSFDAGRQRLSGEPFALAEGVATDRPCPAPFSTSAGVLAYRSGAHEGTKRLRWFDRQGNQLGELGPPGSYRSPSLSPDGRAVAVAMKISSRWDIWVFDLVRGTHSRLTSSRRSHDFPAWAPDSRQIAFSFDRDPAWVVHRVTANSAGNEELAVQLDRSAVLSQWTPDGQFLLMTAVAFGKSPNDIWAAPASGNGKPFSVVTGPFAHSRGTVSPDGNWIAYVGEETGRQEVYVQQFPPKGAKSQIISTAGGDRPKWRADGRELFYREGSKVIAVEVKASAGKFEPSIPKTLFDAPSSRDFDVSSDGERFLLVVPNGEPALSSFTVVINWLGASKR